MSNPPITDDTVRRLARLARLSVDEAALPRLAGDLTKILGYVAVLESVDTDGVEATAQVTVSRLPLRLDEVHEGLSQEAALGDAPQKSGGGFSVPGFVEE